MFNVMTYFQKGECNEYLLKLFSEVSLETSACTVVWASLGLMRQNAISLWIYLLVGTEIYAILSLVGVI